MRVEFQVRQDADDHTLLCDESDQPSPLAAYGTAQDIQTKDAAHELRPQVAVGRAPGGAGGKLKLPIPHGIECGLMGEASFDREQGTFRAFELVAIGRRWGRTQMNGRGKHDAPGLVGFQMELASSAPRIAPTFEVAYGVDWIVPPGLPTWLESLAECGLEED